MKLILGTAGHIDHGKTALVQALTGVDTDRLPEEKQRGITIDLGFANLTIGDVSIGIVDVPGHEDFIRNMLAGATGLDAVLLVVAADEGVMPQTREHLAILDLLNVRTGVVALTKSDLVDTDWLSLVQDDVRSILADTTLTAAPIVPVSAKTGQGLDELRAVIVAETRKTQTRSASDLFRMPLDRVFTVRGTGTVVTGTVWSGRLAADANVHVIPSAVRGRVRGIQVHGAAAAHASAGERAAIALSGVEKTAVQRGDVVVDKEDWRPAHMLTIKARVIRQSEWSLEPRQRVRMHLGTAEVLARAVLLDAALMNAGDEGWIQLRLESPVVARAGDRVVLRSYSPVTTIGGGTVVEIGGRKRSSILPHDVALFESVISQEVGESVRAALRQAERSGVTAGSLSIATPHSPPDVTTVLQEKQNGIVRVGERFYAGEVLDGLQAEMLQAIRDMHVRAPLKASLDRAEVRAAIRGCAPELTDFLIEAAIASGVLAGSGSTLRLAGHSTVLSQKQEGLRSAILEAIRSAGLAPPLAAELAQQLGSPADLEPLLRLLVDEGRLVPVAPGLYMEAGTLAEAAQRTRVQLGGQTLAAADFRATLPVSRKHLIPLLEYFDRIGVTHRQGDLRAVSASESG